MRAYKTVWKSVAPEGERIRFAGSQTEAASDRKQFGNAGAKRADVSTVEIDIPVAKGPLLDFINSLVGQ